ncbi:MAG: hypothetical protein HY923_00975 [Elusimicrobia bacterium]|nr:hypothetical protein [Elusimicrobiota bacterium]
MAAKALLDRGQAVTMLDGGLELDAERRQVVSALAKQEPDAWDPALTARLRGPLDRPELKPSFGSDFPYVRGLDAGLDERGTRCLASLAKGGLSNVWGAAVLPTPREDFDAWPLTADELAPHYKAAGETLRIAAVRDGLEKLFPFYSEPRPPARPTLQAQALLRHLDARAQNLTASGVSYGRARLAVDAEGCRDAGLCLSGCPYGSIWNSAQEVETLRKRPGFQYKGGLRVRRVQSTPGGVRVSARALAGGAPADFEGARAFLACGPLATARLALVSMGLFGRELTLRFQPYFLLPAAMRSNVPGAAAERAMTLAQIFLELRDPAVSSRLVHLQIYTRNEYIADRLSRAARWAGPLAPLVERAFSGRLLAIQGYLHSDEAQGASLRAQADGDDGRLILEARPDAELRRRVRAVASALARRSSDLGFRPLTPLLRVGAPGEGNHVGGIFPMRRSPGELETDALGTLPGLPRVHLVDSSVLPSLSSATFTYTAMANAHRIGSRA